MLSSCTPSSSTLSNVMLSSVMLSSDTSSIPAPSSVVVNVSNEMSYDAATDARGSASIDSSAIVSNDEVWNATIPESDGGGGSGGGIACTGAGGACVGATCTGATCSGAACAVEAGIASTSIVSGGDSAIPGTTSTGVPSAGTLSACACASRVKAVMSTSAYAAAGFGICPGDGCQSWSFSVPGGSTLLSWRSLAERWRAQRAASQPARCAATSASS